MKTLMLICFVCCVVFFQQVNAQNANLKTEARSAMMSATRFMVEKVSTNGGYVALYLPDMSRRWGELEGFDSQIWVQSPGTPSMGSVFLDAYDATSDEYYYQAAEKVAAALIWGQQKEGGWNYIIDFNGERSLKKWYATIGKNAWGFEEYYHYYGNSTFDDMNLTEPAEFLLRLYLIKKDVRYKPAIDKAIQFVLDAQYPLGGWPQRYPLKYEYPKGKHDDYSSFYTYNDEVTSGNIDFLINCYLKLNDSRLLDPIRRGMNFYIITQQGNPQGGWGQQYNMDLQPAYARSYEPAALLPALSYQHGMLLLKYYQLTGDSKFIARIPDLINWLESSKLPTDKTVNGTRTHATFIELGTNKGLYAHRTGTGVVDGKYWYDYDDSNLLAHYGGKANVDIQGLKEAYRKVSEISLEDISRQALLKPGNTMPYVLSVNKVEPPTVEVVKKVISSLDNDRWLVKHVQISRPFTVSASGVETNTAKLSDANGKGIADSSEQEYISTREYVKNMTLLISFAK